MAVVQISRIQVRRGQKNQGSGLPQLASGELGWAVDTRELYIGNGAVSEGSPEVGNTKVLTQYDNIFSLANTYVYREEDAYIATGGPNGTPVRRSLQARLDDRVSVRAFGATGDSSQIATTNLQTAIDMLFLNDANKTNPQSRVELHLEPGTYTIDGTIYLPPFTTLKGAGIDKTVIVTNTALPMFSTVNNDSTPGNPAANSTDTTLNQARGIELYGMTIQTTVPTKQLVLNSCKDSKFKDIKFIGNWTSGNDNALDIAVEMNSLSNAVETKDNIFEGCIFTGKTYAVSSDWDIHDNKFVQCKFSNNQYGIMFGDNMVSLDITANSGKTTGPSFNKVNDSIFEDIGRQAIKIKFGTGNTSSSNRYIRIGNELGNEHQALYPVLEYANPGNSSLQDYFTRSAILSYNNLYWDSFPYVPEIQGCVIAEMAEVHVLNTVTRTGFDVDGNPQPIKRFRLPLEEDVATQLFEVNYILSSRSYNMVRSGVFTIALNGVTKTLSIADSYDYVGDTTYEDSISFSALIQDVNADTDYETLDVNIASVMPSDDISQIEFKINCNKSNVDATGE